MIDISIIIPTLDRREILKKCLLYLFRQEYPHDKYEIIVVDDGSTDGTKEMIKGLTTPCKLSFIKQEPGKNGPACANNQGIKAAQGKIVLFMNSDIYVLPDFLEQHMSFHRKYPDHIIQGPSINTTDFANPLQATSDYSGYSNIQMGYFVTWNASLPKELIVRAGYFDEDFRPYSWEDIELGFRLRKLGVKQKYNKKAIGFHYRQKFTLADLPSIKQKSMIMGKNGVLYYRKHPSLETKICSGCWFFMFWFNNLRGLIAKRLIGTERILQLYQFLFDHKYQRLLAMLVGWAGKYWYMQGVSNEARHRHPAI